MLGIKFSRFRDGWLGKRNCPALADFDVQGVYDSTKGYGLLFNPNMAAVGNQFADARLSFNITVDASSPTNYIDGAYLSISGASAVGTGQVHIAETIYPSTSPFGAVGSLDGFESATSPLNLLDDSLFGLLP